MTREARWTLVSSASDRATLARAIYAASVIGLLVNDHVFKEGSWRSGWVTGKLSDFFGLVVAPLTLCALFAGSSARRGVRRRLACFAVPVAVFILTEISQTAADRVAELVSMTGLSWKLWADASDLVALVVLPGVWWLAAWFNHHPSLEGRSKLLARSVVFVGALACVASGQPVEGRHHALAYLVNRSEDDLDVDVAELRGALDCAAKPRIEPGFLRHEDFVNTARYTLAPNQVLPFETCEPVRVTVNGETFGIQWTRTLPPRTLSESISEEDVANESQLVLIEHTNAGLTPRFGAGTEPLVIAGLLDPLPVSDCAQASLPRLEASALPSRSQSAHIANIRALSEGCFALELDASALGAAGGPSTTTGEIILCMPESEFPFVAGDEIRFSPSWMSKTNTLLSLHWHAGHTSLDGPVAMNFTGSACGPVREACGAIWQPLDITVNGVTLPPGRRQRVTVPGYTPSDYYVVRAFRPILSVPGCAAGLDRLTPHYLEVIEVRGRP